MTGSAKRKGDRAELEVERMLGELLGVSARRKLGAGRRDDMGDIDGVPSTVIQVCSIADLAEAIREKPVQCARQQERAGARDGATLIRLRGGRWRVVLLPEQWASLWIRARES